MSNFGDEPEKRMLIAIEKRFGTTVDLPSEMYGANALATMNERSVCRNYSTRAVDESVIRLLCASALSAPSKSDLQQASIVRVSSRDIRETINNWFPNSPWIAKAPEFLVICGDHSRVQHLFASRSSEFPNNHLDTFFNAAVDAGILLGTLVQAVNFAGLGCCPISEIREHVNQISELLKLPEWVFPVVGVTIGYPAAFEPLSPRLGLKATVHEDTYDVDGIPESVAEYDDRRVRLKPYAQQREADRFGRSSHYGWGEDKFRQYSNVQRADFGAYVRSKGFRLD
ncbi:MAG: nitroreductase family protein [Bdellovibrionota bacterium]